LLTIVGMAMGWVKLRRPLSVSSFLKYTLWLQALRLEW
jgi:hypothetical protein